MAIGELTDEDAHLYGSVDEDRIFRWIMDVAARLAAKSVSYTHLRAHETS